MLDHRSRPRRRGAALERAILDATLEELAEVGYAGLTMDGVARRAGAGKVSVYRRWPTRLQLVLDAAYGQVGEPRLPEEPSSLREDLRAFLGYMADQMAGPVGEAIRGIVTESLSQTGAPSLSTVSRNLSGVVMQSIVDRARARGESVRSELTPLQAQTPAMMVQHILLTRRNVPLEFVDMLVDEVIIPLLTGPEPEPIAAGGRKAG